MPTVNLRVVSPAPRSDWSRLCGTDPAATLCQTPEWTDALCDNTAWEDASRYYEMSDGVEGVLPLVRRGPATIASVHASMPAGWGMGGVVARHKMSSDDLGLITADLQDHPGLGFRILPNPLGYRREDFAGIPGLHVLPRFAHVLDLDGGFDTAWRERFRQTARRNVRKANKQGIEIERDSSGRLIPVYQALLERSVERWAAGSREPHWLARVRTRQADPPGKFEHLAEALGDRLVTMVAWYRGEPAAAVIVLGGSSYFYWRGAMHEDLGPKTAAAYALQSAAIEDACNAGARYYHFGESGTSTGLAHFKERFGAHGYPYPELRFERLPYTRSSLAARGVVKRLIKYDPD